MKVVGRNVVVGAMVCAAIGVVMLISGSSTKKVSAAQKQTGMSVDPANPSDELVDGPYRVDPELAQTLGHVVSGGEGLDVGCGPGRVRPESGSRVRGDARRTARCSEDQAQIRRTRERAGYDGALAGPWDRGCTRGTRPWVPTPARAKPLTTTWALKERTTGGDTSLRYSTAKGMWRGVDPVGFAV